MDSRYKNRLALAIAPLAPPLIFIALYVTISATPSLQWGAFMFLTATLVSYGGTLLIGLPSVMVLGKSGHLNNWTLLLVGFLGGALIGSLETLLIPGNQKGIGPAVLFSFSGAIVAGTFLMLAHIWQQHPQAKQPEGLISVLLDRSREFGDRHDAAMDLASFDDPDALQALERVKDNLNEDPNIVEEAEQSLLEIQRRKSGA